LEDRHPDAAVHTVYLNGDEPRQALLGRRVDTVVTRLPMRTEGLEVTVLYDEPHEMLVFLDHRLASKKSVALEDLEGEPFPRLRHSPRSAPEHLARWPEGAHLAEGPIVDTVEDKLELIAAGRGITIIRPVTEGASDPTSPPSPRRCRTQPHRDRDPDRDRNPLVGAFRKVARNCLIGSAEAGAVSAVDGGT